MQERSRNTCLLEGVLLYCWAAAHSLHIAAVLSLSLLVCVQGQVYRGRLKTGEEVAVKVQRPGVLVSAAASGGGQVQWVSLAA
jgi:hypothetical protein